MLLKLALEGAFKVCNITATNGDAHTLLYGNAIVCDDNLNLGVARVRNSLAQLSTDTFFGKILFDSYRENFAGEVLILQVSGVLCCLLTADGGI